MPFLPDRLVNYTSAFRWCDEQIKNGEPKGKWLMVKLQELRATKTPIGIARNEESGDGVRPGQMNPKTANYDGEEDKLVVTPLRWSQVSITNSHILKMRFCVRTALER